MILHPGLPFSNLTLQCGTAFYLTMLAMPHPVLFLNIF